MWKQTIGKKEYLNKLLTFLGKKSRENFDMIFPKLTTSKDYTQAIDMLHRHFIKRAEIETLLECANTENRNLLKEIETLKAEKASLESKNKKLTGKLESMRNRIYLVESSVDKDSLYVKERLAILDALEEGGVDNWEWYGESLKDLHLSE